MPLVSTDLRNTRENASRIRFEPTVGIVDTNVQDAIERVATSPQAIVSTAVDFASSPYTVVQADTVLYVDTAGGPVTINLQATASRLGVPIVIKDATGHASTNNISIVPNGAETIDGLATLLIASDFGGYRLNPTTSGYTLAP
jgi:hypothetical protein